MKRFINTLGVLAVAVIVLKVFFIGYYRIPQNGMYPALPAGSAFFSFKRAYKNAASVKRGDVIVFVRQEGGQSFNYIWRVIGVLGDKVQADGEILVIDGQAVSRKRSREVDGKAIFREEIGNASYEVAYDRSPRQRPASVLVTVPADHFFVMGDDRFNARDSRYFGPIAFDSIIGKGF